MTNKQQTQRGAILVIAGSLVLLAVSTWAMRNQPDGDSYSIGACGTREAARNVAVNR